MIKNAPMEIEKRHKDTKPILVHGLEKINLCVLVSLWQNGGTKSTL
jgi:hypothetical protein